MSTDLPDLVLLGGSGSGKSTAAKFLEELGWTRYGFAGVAEHPHPGSPRAIVTAIWGPEAINDREKLVGMASAARDLDPDAWLHVLSRALYGVRYPIVVDDCRFENEYYGLKGRGFVSVRFEAPYDTRVERLKGNGKWLDDEYLASPIEHGLDEIKADYTITNDGTLGDLYDDIIWMLNRERYRR